MAGRRQNDRQEGTDPEAGTSPGVREELYGEIACCPSIGWAATGAQKSRVPQQAVVWTNL